MLYCRILFYELNSMALLLGERKNSPKSKGIHQKKGADGTLFLMYALRGDDRALLCSSRQTADPSRQPPPLHPLRRWLPVQRRTVPRNA